VADGCCHTRGQRGCYVFLHVVTHALVFLHAPFCPWPSSSSVSASQSSSTPHTRCRRRHKSTMTHPSRDRLLLGPDDVLASSSVASRSVTMVRVIGCRFLFTLPAAVVGSLRLDKHSQQCMRANRQRTTCVPGGKSVRSCHPGRRRSGCRPPSSGRNALSLSSCLQSRLQGTRTSTGPSAPSAAVVAAK
jgi:hypothetical protein